MSARDIALIALVIVNVLAILALLLWWGHGHRRGPFKPNGRWRYLPVYYGLILCILVEATSVGLLLTAILT